MNLGSLLSWNPLFMMLGMLSAGMLIGVTSIENTDKNIIFLGMLALPFIITSTIIHIKYFGQTYKKTEDKKYV